MLHACVRPGCYAQKPNACSARRPITFRDAQYSNKIGGGGIRSCAIKSLLVNQAYYRRVWTIQVRALQPVLACAHQPLSQCCQA